MTDTPPSPEVPPQEPTEPSTPQKRGVFPPPEQRPDKTTGFAEAVARALLGIVTCGISLVVFTMVMAASEQPAVGLIVAVTTVGVLFVIRKRSGPSPLLGAVVVGASVALVIFGGCMLLIISLK